MDQFSKSNEHLIIKFMPKFGIIENARLNHKPIPLPPTPSPPKPQKKRKPRAANKRTLQSDRAERRQVRVVSMLQDGWTQREIAAILNNSLSTIKKDIWIKRREANGLGKYRRPQQAACQ